MYCRQCGNKLSETANFCEVCGTKVIKNEEVIEEVVYPEEVIITPSEENNEPTVIEEKAVVESYDNEDNGPWKVFAIIGYVYGIVNLVMMLIPFVSFAAAIDGIIFSALGKKSKKQHKYAKTGLTANIVACAINYVWSIVFYILIIYLLA